MSSILPQTYATTAVKKESLLPKYNSKPLRIAVFISGSGRTLKNLIICSSSHPFTVVAVASDCNAPGLQFARNYSIPHFIAPTNNMSQALWAFAQQEQAHLICLAGFIKRLHIPPNAEDKVINIHPALIPKFCGKGMYGNKVHEAVLNAGEIETGCTVHYCDNEYDHGPIILQKKLTINPAWDCHQLANEVFELEKIAYPHALTLLADRAPA